MEDEDDEQHLLSSRKAHPKDQEPRSRSAFAIFVTTAAIISMSLMFASLLLAWKNSNLMSRINSMSSSAIELSNIKHGQEFPPPKGGFAAVTEIAALVKNPPQKWQGNGPPKQTVAPVSIDVIDDSKPGEVVNESENVVINNNITTVYQFHATAGDGSGRDRPMCTIKGIWPSIKDSPDKKLYTMLFDVSVWRLATVVEGEHWIINSDTVYHNANHDNLWPKKAKFPYNKRPERVTQLGKFRAESGVNFELPPFPCPSVDKPPFGRMAVEFSCENCMVSYNHTFWDPMMGFHLVF